MKLTSCSLLITSLALTSPALMAHDITVDCDVGDSLSDAVTSAQSGQSILIQGTCNESIIIKNKQLTLDGTGHSGTGKAVLNGPNPPTSGAVVAIESGQNVTLKNLEIQNGINGVALSHSASATFENVTITNNIVMGLLMEGSSSVRLVDCAINANGVNGMEITGNSDVVVSGNLDVKDNQVFGIDVLQNSSLSFTEATVDIQNNIIGVQIAINSSAFIRDENTVVESSSNLAVGFTVVSTSSLFLFSGKLITKDNMVNGVSLFTNSSIDLDRAATIETSGNGRDGLFVENSTINMFTMPGLSAPTITATNNQRHGVSIMHNAILDMAGEASLTAMNNTVNGIFADDGAAIRIVNAHVTDNDDYDIAATFGSRVDINASEIGVLACDKHTITRGENAKECKKKIKQ